MKAYRKTGIDRATCDLEIHRQYASNNANVDVSNMNKRASLFCQATVVAPRPLN